MPKIALILACFVHLGHARQAQRLVRTRQSSLTARSHEPLAEARRTRTPLGTLAKFVQVLNEPVAFSPTMSGPQSLCRSAKISSKAPVVRCAPSRSPKMAALPSLPVVAAVCTLPTCLGFWKSEYGVSYAYGIATALMGGLVLRAAPTPLAAMHAAALLVYGLRLNIFLLWRELNIERFRKFREKIEERAMKRGSRLKRAPFVLSCSMLYACLAAPIMVTTATAATGLATAALVAVQWAGLLLAAAGDLIKSYVKARQGAETLVTSGPFRFFRHPNYTGEQILWTASVLAAFMAAASGGVSALVASAGWLGAALFGWSGIFFVLAQATASLEKKQSETWRTNEVYQDWKKRTWEGVALKSKEIKKLKLKYFDIRGAAERARLLFALGGEEYEDIRYQITPGTMDSPSFKAAKEAGELKMNLNRAPVLETEEGVSIGQSQAIERFLARRFGLLGKNPVEEATIDSVVEHCRDVRAAQMRKGFSAFTRGKTDEEKAEAKSEWFSTDLPTWLTKIDDAVKETGSPGFAVGSSLSYADVYIFALLRDAFESDKEDTLKAAKNCSALNAIADKVQSQPSVAKYLEERPPNMF